MSKKGNSYASSSQRVLILGSSGRLGSCLIGSESLRNDFELIPHSRNARGLASADLTDRVKTFDMLQALKPSVIINTVALAEIEACEKDPNRAYRTNVLTVQNVVNWISSTVIRTNFVGSSKSEIRQTFSDWFIKCTEAGQSIEVVNDIRFSPVTLRILSSAIATACVQRPQVTANFGSRGGITKYDFCRKVASELNLNLQKVSSVTADECLAYRTYRPKNMIMDSGLWETATGMRCPTIEEVIESVVEEYR